MLEQSLHEKTAKSMHVKVESMIVQKKKATVAIALSMASDKQLAGYIQNSNIQKENYEQLIKNFKSNTLYKNIWIQILDDKGTSLYRSWSQRKGDNLLKIRKDIAEVVASKQITSAISVGLYDLSIKAIIPVMDGDKFVGIIEVISHFNSIAKHMKEEDVDSVVVVATKEYKKQLIKPFSELFIDDYYVANLDASKVLMNYLKDNGIENYFNDTYKIENDYIISSHELLDIKYKPVGYFIMFKKVEDISSVDLDFFMFKWFMIGVIMLMSAVILITVFLFYRYRRTKIYYENIIDTTNNIIIVNDKNGTIDVNRTFFRYFNMYISLAEFQSKHLCVSEFFVDEKGYLKAKHKGVSWVAYMIQYADKNYKIKMKIDNNYYYFSASASIIDDEKKHCAIIMSDITKQEKYKNELERLSITDSLTNIHNRRFFKQKIEEELARSQRYTEPLSLIIFDIDHFKKINDKYGHNVGDEVLIEYTKLISSKLRANDTFCRIGGEEFILILPHTKKDDSQLLAEKLREGIEKCKKVVPITVSFGVVEYIDGEDTESIFKRADKALYKAKDSGRNMVVVG